MDGLYGLPGSCPLAASFSLHGNVDTVVPNTPKGHQDQNKDISDAEDASGLDAVTVPGLWYRKIFACIRLFSLPGSA